MARSITTRSTNPKIMDDNIKILDDALASTPTAEDVSYDNTDSGLTANDIQGAIDEVNDNLENLSEESFIGNISSVTENLIACGSSETVTFTTTAKGWYRLILINTGASAVSVRVNMKAFSFLDVQGHYEVIVPFAAGVIIEATTVGNGAVYLNKFNFSS